MKTASKYTKRQHTVPRVYLKHFGEIQKKETYIHAFDVTKKDSTPFRTNITNVCIETDYYTLKSLPDEKKLILEDFFSHNIEDYYDEVYSLLIDPTVTEIDEDTRFKIIAVCLSQVFRTTKFSKRFNNFWNQIIDFSYELTGNNPDINIVDFGHIKVDTSSKDKDEFIREEEERNKEMVVVKSINQMADLTLRRMNDGISVKKIHEKHKLITSDNPVFFSDNIYNPDSFIRMPIDEDHFIMLIPDKNFNHRYITHQEFDEEWSFFETFTNNVKQIESAERFILGSKNGLDLFLKMIDTLNESEVEKRFQNLIDRMDRISEYFENLFKK